MLFILLDGAILLPKVILYHLLQVSSLYDRGRFLCRDSSKIIDALTQLLCMLHLIHCGFFEYLEDLGAFYTFALVMVLHVLNNCAQFIFAIFIQRIYYFIAHNVLLYNFISLINQ